MAGPENPEKVAMASEEGFAGDGGPQGRKGLPHGATAFPWRAGSTPAPRPRARPANPDGGRAAKAQDDQGPTAEGWEGHRVQGDRRLNLPLPPTGWAAWGLARGLLFQSLSSLISAMGLQVLSPGHGPLWLLWCLSQGMASPWLRLSG